MFVSLWVSPKKRAFFPFSPSMTMTITVTMTTI